MVYYLLKTQIPSKRTKRTNWNRPASSSEPAKHGISVRNELWWASRSKQKIEQVKRSFLKNNPDAKPSIKLTLLKVDRIPDGFL
jgi:hypothetical protein